MSTTFVLACKNGHKVTAPAEEAERLAFTACRVCFKPLFVKSVSGKPAA